MQRTEILDLISELKLFGMAATPTFTIMALLTGWAEPMDRPYSFGHGELLGGMVTMCLLMRAFHLLP
jgi:hypothetical protein